MIEDFTAEDAEILDNMLLSLGDEVMDLEELDGLFAALTCCPKEVSPGEYLPLIFGGYTFDDTELEKEILDKIFAFKEAVEYVISRPDAPANMPYEPFCLTEGDDDVITGEYWARGFVQGVLVCSDEWDRLMENSEWSQCIAPIFVIASQGVGFDEFSIPEIPDDEVTGMVDDMFLGVGVAYTFFHGGLSETSSVA